MIGSGYQIASPNLVQTDEIVFYNQNASPKLVSSEYWLIQMELILKSLTLLLIAPAAHFDCSHIIPNMPEHQRCDLIFMLLNQNSDVSISDKIASPKLELAVLIKFYNQKASPKLIASQRLY